MVPLGAGAVVLTEDEPLMMIACYKGFCLFSFSLRQRQKGGGGHLLFWFVGQSDGKGSEGGDREVGMVVVYAVTGKFGSGSDDPLRPTTQRTILKGRGARRRRAEEEYKPDNGDLSYVSEQGVRRGAK